MVVGDIGTELNIPSSTLSHHLEKLKNEDLVRVRREGTYLWYSANRVGLEELLGFLFAACCTRNKAIEPSEYSAASRRKERAFQLPHSRRKVAPRRNESLCSALETVPGHR